MKLVAAGGRFKDTAINGTGSLTLEKEDINKLEGVLPLRLKVNITTPGGNWTNDPQPRISKKPRDLAITGLS